MSHKPLKQCHMSCKFIQHFSFKNNPTGLHGNFFVFQLQIETAKFIIPSRHKTHRTRNKNETNTKVPYIKTSQPTHRLGALFTCGTPPRKSKRANPLTGAPQPEQQPQKIRSQKTVIQKQQKPQTRTAATANRTHGCKQYSVLQIHITK